MSSSALRSSPRHAPAGPYAETFVENGYCVVESLLTAEELDELKVDLLKLARGHYPCESLQPIPARTDDASAMERILCIHQPHFLSPVVRLSLIHI